MLFVAEYELEWEDLEAAAAKRIAWQELQVEGCRLLAEYIWQDGSPPFRGVAVLEAETVDDVHGFVLHYGPTLTMKVHPASDVMGSLKLYAGASEE